MALKEVTLKRVIDTGGNTDELFPSTTMAQVRVSTSDATTLSSHLTSTYIPLSQKGAASGVATLGSNSKIPESQLPSSVVGGMKFYGTVDLSSGTSSSPVELSSVFGSLLTYANYDDAEYDQGSYVVVTDGGFVKDSSGSQNTTAYHRFDIGDSSGSAPGSTYGEELDATSPYQLEKGDWIIFYKRTIPTSGVKYFLYSIINNTYGDATDSVKGVVELSDISAVNASTSGNQVITQEVLGNLIGTSANTIAAGDHLHDGRYYTESEIGAFFAGTSSITGYNKSNWDTAYGWGDHGAAGYQSATNSQSVTLTGAVTGTGTITNFGNVSIATTATSDPTLTLSGDASGSATFTNLGNATLSVTVANDSHTHDGRYYTESEFNNWLDGTAIDGHTFTEIKYGASPSGTVVGTILIDED